VSYDVFISYAHVDNDPLPPAAEGWVRTLTRSLQILLAQKLGRREAFRMWIDDGLRGNEPLTPQILDQVRGAATMVTIHSPGYRASEWCRQERAAFLGGRQADSRMFVVERDRAERAPELADLRGYRFWIEDDLSGRTRTLGDPMPSADDHRYYSLLGDLAADLARELQCQRAPAPPAAAAGRGAVFLAEVTDDLDPVRDEVRRYLEQKQIRVVPHDTYLARGDADLFRRDVDQHLAGCALFVQLLGPVAGKRPVASAETYVELQLQRARAAGTGVLQWRDPELDLAQVRDPRHAALIESADVLATGLEELKSAIVARLAPPAPPRPQPQSGLVFVNAEGDDLPFATELSRVIERCGSGYVLPLQAGDPTAVREDLERNLLDCDRVMIVYGAATPTWVREQLRYARKVLFRREHALQGLAVYQAPPPVKDPIGFALPNQFTINGMDGVNEHGLRAFLAGAGA